MRLFSLFLMWRKSDEKISKSTRRHFYGKLLFFKDEEKFKKMEDEIGLYRRLHKLYERF